MLRTTIKVPSHIGRLSDWHEFDSLLPEGKVIVDKGICGCGGTEYYLRSDKPVILVSPRRELINCKMNDTNRPHPLYYFDRSQGSSPQVTIDKLIRVVKNPFEPQGFVPKIIVTYDSLYRVIDTLRKEGIFPDFTIVVDEFPCIFTDAKLKGDVEINMIRYLNQIDNHVVFMSATPISDFYLDAMPEFCNIPFITLQWDSCRYEQVRVDRQVMRSTRDAASKVINSYRSNGFFKSAIINGQEVHSTEAVFFLNSVNDIVAIIRKNCLTPDDVLVICADNDENKKKLSTVGFTIGHLSTKENYRVENKWLTMTTSLSFEGSDFYSDCSSAYIFADSNQDHLSLDISIDLPQIAGRCRTKGNPFRRELTYFYKTTEEDSIEGAEILVQRRIEETDNMLNKYGDVTDPALLRKFRNAQEKERYKNDYLEVVTSPDGTKAQLIGNILVKLADLRGIEIKKMQYASNFSVYVYIDDNGFSTADTFGNNNATVNSFCQEFFKDQDFVRRMKLYVKTLEKHPEIKGDIEAIPQIPMDFKYFFNILNPEKIKALEYRKSAMEREVAEIESFNDIQNALENVLSQDPRHIYTNYELKAILQQVYDDLNVIKRAKATDITKYVPSAQTKSVTDIYGKRQRGYEL